MADPAMLGDSGYPRFEDDFYETPEWCVEVLLRHVVLKHVWEPACGRGAIARVLLRHGIDVTYSDLRDHGTGWANYGVDFLKHSGPMTRDIVTNPPYSLAEAFVRHALDITAGHAWVAMLLRNEWDCAVTRDDLFVPGSRFASKIVLTDRPRWIPGSTERPRHNYAWFVWGDVPRENATILRGR